MLIAALGAGLSVLAFLVIGAVLLFAGRGEDTQDQAARPAASESAVGETLPDTDEAFAAREAQDEAAAEALARATASSCSDAEEDGKELYDLMRPVMGGAGWADHEAFDTVVGAPFETLAAMCGESHAREAVAAAGLHDALGRDLEPYLANGASAYAGGDADLPTDVDLDAPGHEVAAFASPSGNIVCALGQDAVCRIADRGYSPPPAPQGCPATDWGNVVRVDGAEAGAFACAPGPGGEGVQPLEYGQATRVGAFVCGSSQDGVVCRHAETKHGFWVRRAGYSLF